MGQFQARELDLLGTVAGQGKLLEEPVIEGAVGVELQAAQGVRDALDGVALAVCPVVGGVDAPCVAGVVVVRVAHAVHHRVAQPHVLCRHVDLGPQTAGPVRELTTAHAAQEVEVLLGRTVTEGGIRAGDAETSLLGADGLRILVVDIGETLLHQILGPRVQLLEVVGGVDRRAGLVSEPGDVVLDRLDVFDLLGAGVRVVQAQVAGAAEVAGHAEILDDGLGMSDVEVAVGLGWKAGLHPAAVGALGDVLADDVADEVTGGVHWLGRVHARKDSVRPAASRASRLAAIGSGHHD